MTTIGYATLQIIPTLTGVTDAVNKQMGGLAASGKTAGKAISDGIASGVDAAAKKVEQASAKVATARTKEADAAGKVKVAEAQLQSLRDKGVTDAGRLAAAEEKVNKAKRDSNTASQNLARATKDETAAQDKLTEANKRVKKATDDTVTSGNRASSMLSTLRTNVRDTTGGMDGLTSKVKSLGAALASNLGIGVGAGLAGLAASVVAMGDTFAQANKTLAFTTGATGAELEALNASVRDIGKDSAKSLGDIATVMANVARSTQLTGDPLEALTKQMLKLDAMGQSLNMDQLTMSMRAFGVPAEDMSAQLDEIFKVSREVGAPIADMISTLTTGAPQLTQFGLSMSESALLLGGFRDAGIDSDKAMVALNTALKKMSLEGGDVRENLADAVAQIKAMMDAGDQAGANAAASQLFGGRAFAPMLAAIQDGKLNLDELTASLGDNQNGILDSGGAVVTLSGAWQMLKNNVLITVEPLVTKIFASMQDGIKWFRTTGVESIRAFGDKLAEIWSSAGVQEFVSTVVNLFQTSWPRILDTVQMVGTALIEIGQVAGPIVVDALGTVVGAIERIVDVGNGIATFFRENKELAIGLGVALTAIFGPAVVASTISLLAFKAQIIATTVVQAAISTATKVWAAAQWLLNAALSANPIGLIVAAIAGLVAGIVYAYNHSDRFRAIVQAAWQGIKVVMSATWNWISGTLWPGIKKVFQGIGDIAMWLWDNAIKPYFGFIKSGISTAWDVIQFVFSVWKKEFQLVGEGAMWLWENAIKPAWDGITAAFSTAWDFVSGIFDKFKTGWEVLKTGVVGGAEAIGSGIKKAFSGLVDIIKAPLKALGGFLAEIPTSVFGVDIPGASTLNNWGQSLRGLSEGGYTGNVSTGQIAGVVHGDEHVIRASSRRRIEANHPGLLDRMNATGQVPGFETGGRVPYGLAAGTDTGGYGSSGDVFPEWVHEMERRFGVKASTYDGHQEGDGLNKGIDWSGPVDAMQRFAEYLRSISSQLEQVIWENPQTGERIGVADGQLVGPGTSQPGYYRDDWDDHRNHVHTRQSYSFGDDPTISTSAPGTPVSSALGLNGGTPDYSGLSEDEREDQYEADTEQAEADYEAALAALKEKYGIDASTTEFDIRARDIAKRKRDLDRQYRADQAAADGDQIRLDALKDDYEAASDALQAESDKLTDDKDAAETRSDQNTPAYEAAKEELDKQFERTKDALKDAYDTASESSSSSTSSSSGSYPTSISGWAGFAAQQLIGGQVASLLSVFGIPDSPGWLQGLTQLMGGIKVSDADGNSIFDGSNPLAALMGPQTQTSTAPETEDAVTAPTAPVVAPQANYRGGTPEIHNAVYAAFRDAGFTDAMWPDYVNIENGEASWNPNAVNPTSGAYGLAQFLGQSNVDRYLGGSTDEVPVDVQARGMMQYIKDRYGDPSAAWKHWQENNWYARGGLVEPVGFAGGHVDFNGLIHGPGTGTSDSILGIVDGMKPIKVSNGESIVTAAATRANPGLITALNRGLVIRGYDTGDEDLPPATREDMRRMRDEVRQGLRGPRQPSRQYLEYARYSDEPWYSWIPGFLTGIEGFDSGDENLPPATREDMRRMRDEVRQGLRGPRQPSRQYLEYAQYSDEPWYSWIPGFASGFESGGTKHSTRRSSDPGSMFAQDPWRLASDGLSIALGMVKGFAGAGGVNPAVPQINYNIQARDTEDAFIKAQRQERERAAAKLSRY